MSGRIGHVTLDPASFPQHAELVACRSAPWRLNRAGTQGGWNYQGSLGNVGTAN